MLSFILTCLTFLLDDCVSQKHHVTNSFAFYNSTYINRSSDEVYFEGFAGASYATISIENQSLISCQGSLSYISITLDCQTALREYLGHGYASLMRTRLGCW